MTNNDPEGVFSLGGDFNAILSPVEKLCGKGYISQSHHDIVDFVLAKKLHVVELRNGNFTWTNKRMGFTNIVERIEKFMLGGDWNDSNWLC